MYYNKATDADRTITLSRNDLLAAKRLLQVLLGAEDQLAAELQIDAPSGSVSSIDRATLTARARAEFQNRRRRGTIFAQSLFGEAAWDMLLALYILDVAGQRQTVGGIMQCSGVPTTTAKRWLDFLVGRDLVQRAPHPTDQRTAFVSLTQTARDKLDLYFSGTVETEVSTGTGC